LFFAHKNIFFKKIFFEKNKKIKKFKKNYFLQKITFALFALFAILRFFEIFFKAK